VNAVRIAKALRDLADAIADEGAEESTPQPAQSETRIQVTELDRAKARKALRRIGSKV
jgi:hypothetical protein